MRVARFLWCIGLPTRRHRRLRCADRVVCRTTAAVWIMTCSPAPCRQSVVNRRMRWTRHRYLNQKGSATTTVPSWRYATPRRERPHISYTYTVREMWIATWCLGFVLFSCPNCLYVCIGRATAQNITSCDPQGKSKICGKKRCLCPYTIARLAVAFIALIFFVYGVPFTLETGGFRHGSYILSICRLGTSQQKSIT